MKFTPFPGYCEVEPLTSNNPLASDEKKFIEAAKVIRYPLQEVGGCFYDLEGNLPKIKEGDIIFFRPHGFFETPEYEGEKHYVVRVHNEIILGKISE